MGGASRRFLGTSRWVLREPQRVPTGRERRPTRWWVLREPQRLPTGRERRPTRWSGVAGTATVADRSPTSGPRRADRVEDGEEGVDDVARAVDVGPRRSGRCPTRCAGRGGPAPGRARSRRPARAMPSRRPRRSRASTGTGHRQSPGRRVPTARVPGGCTAAVGDRRARCRASTPGRCSPRRWWDHGRAGPLRTAGRTATAGFVPCGRRHRARPSWWSARAGRCRRRHRAPPDRRRRRGRPGSGPRPWLGCRR